MFGKVMSVVLSLLNISAFAKDKNGKSVLLSTQEKQLEEKYGKPFLEVFKKDLEEFEKSGKVAEEAVTDEVKAQLEADRDKNAKELKEAREKIAALDAKIAEKDAEIAKLGKEETKDAGIHVEGGAADMTKKFKPDMTLAHNMYLDAAFKGAAYSGDSTIETTEIQKEFGKYVSSERIEIIKGLLATTESTKYMSTVVTDKVEIRAQQAAIDSVLQQFVPKWTPKGKSKFTPLTIKNYKCKINVPITPSDIMEDIIGYLYDENLKPEDMPVVKYILHQLIFPKLDEEREIALAVGEFKETTATQDGDDATDANDVMDGYVTQLKKYKEEGKAPITWLLNGIKLEDTKLVEQIDKAVDEVAPLYKKKTMFIHADPELVTKYSKAYRKLYPWLKNEDGEKIKVDFSRFTFAPLEGMRGTGVFFITPKENFKHLRSKDPQNTKVWMQGENYDVKIFAEWWEAVGFWLAEAIFAYLPPEEAEGSSASGGL
ncbi:hypothetical protein DW932_18195 [Bacteroides intestinalis]|jgi:hypothetical protein|uniref:hypothetical protein n=1 Tax=Bacteroides intestinalis TaxID=329854 RepID=UPI000E4F1DEA|nr:hypothetical protein [Bacteroides intestinalis]RHA57643.1 hypothetical protein DW932_18195 [Bacteroides intestinalis]